MIWCRYSVLVADISSFSLLKKAELTDSVAVLSSYVKRLSTVEVNGEKKSNFRSFLFYKELFLSFTLNHCSPMCLAANSESVAFDVLLNSLTYDKQKDRLSLTKVLFTVYHQSFIL